jgi:hypothetical protein
MISVKRQLAFIPALLLFIVVNIKAQTSSNENIIPIKDLRSEGLEKRDTSTAGHKLNDVAIIRTRFIESSHKDTLDKYEVYLYKLLDGRLWKYQMGYSTVGEFDKASYNWQTDSVVKITLINSASPMTNKTLSLSPY